MAKSMALCLTVLLAVTLVQAEVQVKAAAIPVEVKEQPQLAAIEQSTESPIADMALIEDAPMVPKMPKMPTEKPPMAATLQAMEKSSNPQPHTVADFIIHPLIAFKPRPGALDELQAQGKQATPGATGGTSSSPSTWLFGMNPGQGLGSSFSTLAGSVSGWFNDRLAAAGQQLPGLNGLVETPVRDTASTSSTTSTTTQRPDIVVRVQQRPNRRRINANGNGNGNKNKNRNGNSNRVQRPNRFNNRLDSLESDEYDDDYFNGNRYEEQFDDDEQQDDQDEDEQEVEVDPSADDQSLEQLDDEEDEQPTKRRRINQSQTALRPKPQSASQRGQPLALLEQAEDEEEEEDDDVEQETEDDDDDVEESDESFAPVIYTQSSRKSQGQPGFIQNRQQSLINQLRRFTFGQTPGELGNKLRKSQSPSQSQLHSGQSPARAGARRPQQATLLVNRNGQTVYVAPELLDLAPGYPYGYAAAPVRKQQRLPATPYPQPPLTVPVRRKGRPTQYITIPWSQLGLSPPDRQSVVSLAEGIQSQPLILNIPESAISSVPVRGSSSGNSQKKKKRPTLTASAVPLLADASLMDIFQPPQIPPSRTGSNSGSGSGTSNVTKPKPKPVLISAKPVQTGGLLPTRIRPGTIVEKAPAMDSTEMYSAAPAAQVEQQQQKESSDAMDAVTAAPVNMNAEMPMVAAGQALPEQEYIIVGEDNEPGLSRHVQPAFGDARYVSYGDFQPYFDLIQQNRRFALRKAGRGLQAADETPIVQV
ncbi:histone H3.v1 [Drosophila innubila]|uniref:histone H3.v1 n=1 Tax=Drosophila innubila TaxID=198719 RepID=UPI00148BAFEE|nr:histone H3.v1 [Drosophila innubila]